jgi:hypothetical protein
MTNEDLYRFTLIDLEQKIEKATEYDLIRACGLLRHLILDGGSLVHIVNRPYKLKLRFIVSDQTEIPPFPHNRLWINPMATDNSKTVELSLDEFLNRKVLITEGETFFVKDIITTAAHVRGGVHSGTSNSKIDMLMNFEKTVLTRYRIDLMAIKSICRIVLTGLTPLAVLLQEKDGRTPTGGLEPQS